MMERCIMCGAGDDSLNHPDYSDCMGKYITCKFCN